MTQDNADMQAQFENMMRGYIPTEILCAGHQLGVFARIAKGAATAEAVAEALAADLRGMTTLLNALVAMGLLAKRAKKFSLAPIAAAFLDPASESYKGYMVDHVIALKSRWSHLGECVTTGRPAPREAPASREESEARARTFALAMVASARESAAEVASSIDFTGVRRVLDLGGGPGVFLFEMLRLDPGMQGVIMDSRETLKTTRELIGQYGMSRRVGTIEGDFMVDDLGSEVFDLVFMSNIIHIYSEEDNRALVAKVASALTPGGRAVVQDFFVDATGAAPAHAAFFGVNMIVNTDGGGVYQTKQAAAWMKAAGLTRISTLDLGRSALVTGTKRK